ncbi:MAG: response regulator, partial [Thermodesulfobacteriota bacterium]
MMVNSKPQTRIMVVDDQEDITWSLSQALSDKEVNATVATAASGEEALDKLSDETINLLITDIAMLEVNDQDLFIEIKKKYPAVSVIVMTAFPSASFKKEAVLGDNLFFVEKPFDINKLKKQVVRILTEKASVDIAAMAGISITDIIQLKCLAGATTTLQVNHSNRQGLIHFKNGEIIHAVCDQHEGEEAFYEVLAFGKGVITIVPFLEKVETTISRPCMTLVRENIGIRETAERRAAEKEEARKRTEEEEAARKKAEEEA